MDLREKETKEGALSKDTIPNIERIKDTQKKQFLRLVSDEPRYTCMDFCIPNDTEVKAKHRFSRHVGADGFSGGMFMSV